MLLYIVLQCEPHEGGIPLAVFSTEARAEAFVKEFNEKSDFDYAVSIAKEMDIAPDIPTNTHDYYEWASFRPDEPDEAQEWHDFDPDC